MNKLFSVVTLVVMDVISIFISIVFAVSFRKILNFFWDVPVIDYSYVTFVAVYITLLLIFTYQGVYTKRFDFWHESKIIARACFLSFLMLFAALALDQNAEYYSRSTLVLIFLISSIVIPIMKLITKKFLFNIGLWQKSAKIITENDNFHSELFSNYYLGYIESKEEEHDTLFIDSKNIDKIRLDKIIEDNIRENREIIFTPVLNGYDFSQSYIYNIFNSRVNVFTLENNLLSKTNMLIKSSLDYVLVISTMIFWVPIFVIIALWIKKEDPSGSIFFIQRRLGINGKEFLCYKFRTMYSDQSFMPEWLDTHPEEKAYYNIYHKYMNDPRITKAGAFLRKTSLDELPQLFNVLKGEMSLIGPRPYMIIEKKDIGNKYPLVLAVKPGITGLWQVSGRNDVDFNTRVEMDVWYMKNWSLWNDITILFKTVSTVLKRRGAY